MGVKGVIFQMGEGGGGGGGGGEGAVCKTRPARHGAPMSECRARVVVVRGEGGRGGGGGGWRSGGGRGGGGGAAPRRGRWRPPTTKGKERRQTALRVLGCLDGCITA